MLDLLSKTFVPVLPHLALFFKVDLSVYAAAVQDDRRSSLPDEAELRIVGLAGRLFGLVQPLPKVAVDEDLLPQQSHQIGEAPTPGRAQMQVAQQQHGNQGAPDLNSHRVLAGADESLDWADLGIQRQAMVVRVPVWSQCRPGTGKRFRRDVVAWASEENEPCVYHST